MALVTAPCLPPLVWGRGLVPHSWAQTSSARPGPSLWVAESRRPGPLRTRTCPHRFPQSTSSTFNLHPQDRNQPSLHMTAETRPLSEVPQGTHHTSRGEGRSWGRGHRTPPCPSEPPLWFPGALVSGFMDHTVYLLVSFLLIMDTCFGRQQSDAGKKEDWTLVTEGKA